MTLRQCSCLSLRSAGIIGVLHHIWQERSFKDVADYQRKDASCSIVTEILLQRLDFSGRENMNKLKESEERVSEQLCSLQELTAQLEEKCGRPAAALLQVRLDTGCKKWEVDGSHQGSLRVSSDLRCVVVRSALHTVVMKTLQCFLRKVKTQLSCGPACCCWVYSQREVQSAYQRDICTSLFTAAAFTIAKK